MKLFESSRVEKLVVLFLLGASLLVFFQAVNAFQNMFQPAPLMGNVITVEGNGTVTAVPDIARINFSVYAEAETAADAQDMSAEKINAAIDLLKGKGIAEVDIKTTSYNVSPKYSRPQPCYNGFCPEYEQNIIGFTVNQSVEVKVRNLDDVSDILSELGATGVTNIYGPSFTIDDPDALQAEARELAIADAKDKAKKLAKDLNVRLVRVTSFWENQGPHYPYYEERAYGLGGDAAVMKTANAPEIPTGESEVSSYVSITYEIR